MTLDRPGTRGPSGMDPSLPLAELVSEQRLRLSLSLGGVARRMHQAAEQEGNRHCGATRQTIHQIEHGRIPTPTRSGGWPRPWNSPSVRSPRRPGSSG
jgi:hypothetical protein